MSLYLHIGGPKHGEELEVEDAQLSHQVLAVPEAFGAAEPHLYIKRTLSAKKDGVHKQRDVFISTELPQQVAIAALSNVLLGKWILDGRDAPPEDDEEVQDERPASGLLLPGN